MPAMSGATMNATYRIRYAWYAEPCARAASSRSVGGASINDSRLSGWAISPSLGEACNVLHIVLRATHCVHTASPVPMRRPHDGVALGDDDGIPARLLHRAVRDGQSDQGRGRLCRAFPRRVAAATAAGGHARHTGGVGNPARL